MKTNCRAFGEHENEVIEGKGGERRGKEGKGGETMKREGMCEILHNDKRK